MVEQIGGVAHLLIKGVGLVTRYSLSALLLASLSMSIASGNEVYQWRDEAGRLHFGDRANHPEAQRRVIEAPAVAAPDSGRRAAEQKLLDIMAEERLAKKQQAAERKAEKERLRQECIVMKTDLWELEHGYVVYYRFNEAGEQEFVSDQERKQQAQELRRRYEELCN